MRKHLALLGAAFIGLAAPAYGQVTSQTQNQISGNECWMAGQGPGGPGQYLCVNMVRNSTASAVITGTGAVTTIMTINQSGLIWSGVAPTTWAVTLPASPFDGELVTLSTDTTLTAMVTVTAGAGATMNQIYAAQTLTANTSVVFRYVTSTAKWYRTQ